MKKALRVAVFTSTFFFSNASGSYAQLTTSKYELGINAGAFIYQGDLTPSATGSFKTPSFVLGINGSRKLNQAFSVRLDLNLGKLKGDDAKYNNPEWRQHRAFKFKSSVTEVLGSLVWSPVGTSRRFSPYLFAGIGYSFLNIKRDYSAFDAAYFSEEPLTEQLGADISRSLPKAIPIVPLGIGIRYPLKSNISVHTEVSYRYMSTDYLDGFSESANPDKNDHYYKYSIGISYLFGRKDKYGCPVIRY
jgi:hypothetical protein